MDRRGFLKTTSAVAASVAASATAAATAEPAATAIQPGITRVILATSWAPDAPGFSAQRLVQRIETVSDGRIAIEIAADANARDQADLTFGSVHDHTLYHPAFAFFAGLPGAQSIDAPRLSAWLAIGGGQMLWDELAAGFGIKPLLAGHTGPSTGLWSNRALEALSDLTGARIFAAGLAGDVLRTLGADAIEIAPQDLRTALGDGRIDAAEWLGPLAAVAPDLRPLAERLYTTAGLTRNGMALALTVRKDLWDRMNTAQQAIFETCAAAEYQAALVELHAHGLPDRHVTAQARQLPLAREIVLAVDRAASDAVKRLADVDPISQRIADSYNAFRELMTASQDTATA